MTNWKIVEPADEEAKLTREVIYSEQMILDEFYDYWCKQLKKLGREHLISKENCINDWIVVNWAEKTNEPVGERIY